MDKIDRVISAVRRLNEEEQANIISGGQIAGTEQAGDDPPGRNKKRKIYLQGMRKWWWKQIAQTTGKNK
jgi:hypothetical protein